jgi:hypothetical protein
LFRSKGIEPILIKGPAAGLHYPVDNPRDSIDIDLAVSAEDYDSAAAIVKSQETAGLAIDLHNELRRLDTRPWAELFRDSKLVQMGGVDVRILRPEDHLRVLIVHWLTNGAGDADRLWDVYYLIDDLADTLSWDAVFRPISPIRQRWIACTIGLAHIKLGLNIDSLPDEYGAHRIPSWFSRFVEAEWSKEISNKPLHLTLNEPSQFFRQLGSRLRMNPVEAMVRMEGSIDSRIRVHYRIGSFAVRAVESAKRIGEYLLRH